MGRPLKLSHAERGMKTRNFTCDICMQRWPESEYIEQDGLQICKVNCYEQGGGTIDRDLERAAAAELASVLDAHEQRPVIYPRQINGISALSYINEFSVRPLTITAGGAPVALVLTGGFQATDTVTYDHAGITNATTVIAATTITLTVQASAPTPKGLHSLFLNDEPYTSSIDVR